MLRNTVQEDAKTLYSYLIARTCKTLEIVTFNLIILKKEIFLCKLNNDNVISLKINFKTNIEFPLSILQMNKKE